MPGDERRLSVRAKTGIMTWRSVTTTLGSDATSKFAPLELAYVQSHSRRSLTFADPRRARPLTLSDNRHLAVPSSNVL